VHEQRIQLIERNTLCGARCTWENFVVSGVDARRESAEELHHGEIDLAVSEVRGRIDEIGLTVRTRQDVAGPEVTVKATEVRL